MNKRPRPKKAAAPLAASGGLCAKIDVVPGPISYGYIDEEELRAKEDQLLAQKKRIAANNMRAKHGFPRIASALSPPASQSPPKMTTAELEAIAKQFAEEHPGFGQQKLFDEYRNQGLPPHIPRKCFPGFPKRGKPPRS